jgi:hypothetical protein
MAKRHRRNGSMSKSKLPPKNNVSVARPATSSRSVAERGKKNLAGAPSLRPSSAEVPTQRASRTPLPSPIVGELEEINLGGARARPGRSRARPGQRIRPVQDQADRFQHIQDFLHNPSLFDLRGKDLDTSSTPEEIEARTGEVRYQIQVIRSLMTVLTEELKTLERARPKSPASRTSKAQW